MTRTIVDFEEKVQIDRVASDARPAMVDSTSIAGRGVSGRPDQSPPWSRTTAEDW